MVQHEEAIAALTAALDAALAEAADLRERTGTDAKWWETVTRERNELLAEVAALRARVKALEAVAEAARERLERLAPKVIGNTRWGCCACEGEEPDCVYCGITDSVADLRAALEASDDR